MVSKPSLFYLFAERRAASYKFLEDDKALIDDLKAVSLIMW